MDTILSKRERCEVHQQIEDDVIYKFIRQVITDITYQCPTFPISAEDVYCEVMKIIDTIRENEGSRECDIYVGSKYKELFTECLSLIKSENADVNIKNVHRTTATIIYISSVLLLMVHQTNAGKYAMALQMSIDDPDFFITRMLLEKTVAGIGLQFNEQTTEQWQAYYQSDLSKNIQIQDLLKAVRQFDYIDMRGLEEYGLKTYDEFITLFQQATEADAPILVEFLRKYQTLGILNFHHDNAKQILENIRMRFPSMKKYDYANFAKYVKQFQLLPERKRKSSTNRVD